MEPDINNIEVSIQCSRSICKNQIEFTDKSQFDSYTDKDNKKIYFYIANHHALIRQQKNMKKDAHFSYQSVYGNTVRIFCNSCSNYKTYRYNMQRCKFNFNKRHNRCNNKDTEFVLGILFTQIWNGGKPYDVCHEICRNHPLCNQCDKALAYKAIKCRKCKQSFCKKETCSDSKNKICKQCSIIYEYKTIYNSIKIGIDSMNLLYDVDINIFKLITDDAMGIGILCCNKDDKCNNDIICNNKHQFRNKMDLNSEPIHYYKPKYFNSHQKPTVLVKNERLRVFCSACTRCKIKRCTKQKKRIYSLCNGGFLLCDNIKESGNGICGNHPFCAKCKCQNKDSPLNKCKKCDGFFCDLHVIDNKRKKHCEHCISMMEFRDIRRRIKLSLKHMEFENECFMDIMASFAMGTALVCLKKECQNEIITNNQYQFEKCIDYKGDKIHHYATTSNGDHGYKAVEIYSKFRIIFCGLCISTLQSKKKIKNEIEKNKIKHHLI